MGHNLSKVCAYSAMWWTGKRVPTFGILHQRRPGDYDNYTAFIHRSPAECRAWREMAARFVFEVRESARSSALHKDP
jgi:hypothetical protein